MQLLPINASCSTRTLKTARPSIANYKAVSVRPVKHDSLSTVCYQNSLYLRDLKTVSIF